LTNLLGLFANNLLPIFLIAGAGYVVGAVFDCDARSLASVTFNIFSPCLVFNVIVTSGLGGDAMARMAFVAAASILGVGALAWAAGHALRLPRGLLAALILTAMLPNAGNYGLSVTMLAFGASAVAYAGVFFATSSVIMYTVGVVVASMGSASLRTALVGLLRVPAVYAVALALLMIRFSWQLPGPLDKTVTLVANAAIPAFLVVLGLQMHRVQSFRPSRLLLLSGGLRLLVSPALVLLLISALGMVGPARQAAMIEGAMPTAIAATILAETYGVEPAFVTSAVFLTTLVSPLTLTPLLAWLGAG
jgi:malate permease and related proteins